jgi:hypothetical protein
MTTIEELLVFVEEEIKELTNIQKEMLSKGNHAAEEFTRGAISAYDVVRIKIEGKVDFL